MLNQRIFIGLMLLAVLLFFGGCQSEPTVVIIPKSLNELNKVVHPLRTVDASDVNFSDLQFLRETLQNKRVVAMGEATHGTREFFTMKSRMFKFLVQELGFNLFGLEQPTKFCAELTRYVSTGQGDPAIALSQGFWPWNTGEVLDLVKWMRSYNADSNQTSKLKLYCLNPSYNAGRDKVMADNVVSILQKEGESSRMMIWAHNMHVSTLPENQAMGSFLKQMIGDQLYVIGFEFDHGKFTSTAFPRGLQEYEAEPAGKDYYAYDLSQLPFQQLMLDFQSASLRSPAVAEWLNQPKKARSLDEWYFWRRFFESKLIDFSAWNRMYNAIIFIRETSSTKPGLHQKPE